RKLVRDQLQALSRDFSIDLDMAFGRLPRKQREILLFGSGKQFEGLIPNLRRRYDGGTWAEQEELEPFRSLRPCPTCGGRRLKKESLSVKVKDRTLSEYVDLPVSEALDVFDGLYLTDREHDEEASGVADYVIDLGPGAGDLGGRVIVQGTPKQLLSGCGSREASDSSNGAECASLTAAYLTGAKSIPTPKGRRPSMKGD